MYVRKVTIVSAELKSDILSSSTARNRAVIRILPCGRLDVSLLLARVNPRLRGAFCALGTRRDDHATPSWGAAAAGRASAPPRFASVNSNFSEESFHPPPTLLPNSLKPLPSSAGTTSVDFGGRDRGGGGGVRQRRRCDPSVCPSSVRLSVPPSAPPSVRLTA